MQSGVYFDMNLMFDSFIVSSLLYMYLKTRVCSLIAYFNGIYNAKLLRLSVSQVRACFAGLSLLLRMGGASVFIQILQFTVLYFIDI